MVRTTDKPSGTNGKVGNRSRWWVWTALLVIMQAVIMQIEAQEVEQTVSLSFQDVEVRAVLQILADDNGLNLVVSEDVTGTITLQLENVQWEQALQAVLQSRNLGRQLLGNVLYVAPEEEILVRELQAANAGLQSRSLAPLQTEFVQINYADATGILALLNGSPDTAVDSVVMPDGQEQMPPAEPGEESVALLSPRGSATVDVRTNVLIIRDTPQVLAEVRELLQRLDVPVRQVLIEARIVNVATDVGRDIGVRWTAGRGLDAEEGGAEPAGAASFAGTLNGTLDGTRTALSVDLGIPGRDASRLAIGFARSSDLIELELAALESTGQGEVIARPRITTQDKVTATIQSGVRIPYQAQAGGTAGGSTTEFVDALLSLQVTPQITPDGRIIMQLDLHQDSVAAGSGGVPAINTNSLSTQVLVADADTIVLGGVFRDETTVMESRTPLLADIPYLGRLFTRSSSAQRRTELLIFITPRIVGEPTP